MSVDGADEQGQARCPSCGKTIDAQDAFCRHCGRRQAAAGQWYHSPRSILILAFTVLGPFAIPLIWRSPRMGTAMKWFLTLVITAVTVLVLYILYVFIAYLLGRYWEIQGVYNDLHTL